MTTTHLPEENTMSFTKSASVAAASEEAARLARIEQDRAAAVEAEQEKEARDFREISHVLEPHRRAAATFLESSFGDLVKGYRLGRPALSYLLEDDRNAKTVEVSSLEDGHYTSLASVFDFPVMDAGGVHTGAWLRTIPSWDWTSRDRIEVRKHDVLVVDMVTDSLSKAPTAYGYSYGFAYRKPVKIDAFASRLDNADGPAKVVTLLERVGLKRRNAEVSTSKPFTAVVAERGAAIETKRWAKWRAQEARHADREAQELAQAKASIEPAVKAHREIARARLVEVFGQQVQGFTLGDPSLSYLRRATGTRDLEVSSLDDGKYVSIASVFDFPVMDADGEFLGVWLRTIPGSYWNSYGSFETQKLTVSAVEFIAPSGEKAAVRYQFGWGTARHQAVTLEAFGHALDVATGQAPAPAGVAEKKTKRTKR
jgi:hypothetical protein